MELLTVTAKAQAPLRRQSKGVSKRNVSMWSRRIHSWTSMVCMLLILFFALTGLTLNHPEWAANTQTSQAEGTLPAQYLGSSIDYLGISEYLRSNEGVHGIAQDHGAEGGQGRIVWAGPSYEASVFFDTTSGAYTLTESQYGIIAWFNDLHKGRNTSPAWSWVIDASAITLTVVALTGLVLQMMLTKKRNQALILLGVGTVATIVLFTLH